MKPETLKNVSGFLFFDQHKMKIALVQQNYRVGDFTYNLKKITEAILRAKADGAELAVFPELSLCGYPPLDFLEYQSFIEHCYESIEQIKKLTDLQFGVIIGAPSVNPKVEGKNLFNSAWFLAEGETKQIINKCLLPNYDVFDEYRYFEPSNDTEIIKWKDTRIALTICEDLWDVEEDLMYQFRPMDKLIKQNPELMINIAASPFNFRQAEKRKEILQRNTLLYQLPVLYVNHTGAQTELIFDGGSMVMNAKGEVVNELNYFKEDYRLIDSKLIATSPSVKKGWLANSNEVQIARIHDALVLGIRDYFSKMGFKKAILGLSGGIDSAVVYALAIEALGNENVLGVMLPSEFSSNHSISDSELLAQNLNGQIAKISIENVFQTFLQALKPFFDGLPFNLAEENIQSRSRAVLLMAMANKLGYILLNTSNKSEAAVGYGTLYGDMCGGISVIGDVYKTRVYELARYINRSKEIIPENILTKAPSAELRPNQKDSDSLPDYAILDQILESYIEDRKSRKQLLTEGFEPELIERVLLMVNQNEWKRFQTPPILRVSSKAFGLGRRMPIVGRYEI